MSEKIVIKGAVAIAAKPGAASRLAMASTRQSCSQVTATAFAEALENGRSANKRMRSFAPGFSPCARNRGQGAVPA